MKYKIYSNLIIPPISGISNFKGREEFLFNSVLELIKFIEQKVEEVDFIEIIETYRDYANECIKNFNLKHFYIDCLTRT